MHEDYLMQLIDDPDHSACNVVSACCTPGDREESFPNFTVLLD